MIATLLGLGALCAATLAFVLASHRRKENMWLAAWVCAASALLYAWLGQPRMGEKLEAHRARLVEAAAQVKDAAAAVEAEPEAPARWAALGDAFFSGMEYASAANAYKQAVIRSGGHAPYILRLCRAQILEAGGLTPEAKQGLELVLSLDPGNAEAQTLLAAKEAEAR